MSTAGTSPDTSAPYAREQALSDQLRAVHDMLRRDLASVRDLAARVANGASSEDVRSALGDLRTSGPLFHLQVNCLTWCQTVHSHHQGEDADLFPAVRRSAPHLAETVNRLEADHRQVQVLLGEVESMVDGLDDVAMRGRLVDALGRLSGHLLEHLELEERVLAPVLDSWDGWPPQS
jgi:iron-sulfur cluster repair protein YtfE (RIC family)